ncbi:hypothetical protein FACS1894202_14760 [Clostridia bacterium]|nr:hypothetical protein FACS1894202_14760 [Clostridia bacterium]
MSVTVSATFETVDSADFALAALRREGMNVEHYKVNPATSVVGFTNLSEYSGGMSSLVYDEVLGAMDTRRYDDTHSSEATLRVTVADLRDAADTEGILISHGGYKLRQTAE